VPACFKNGISFAKFIKTLNDNISTSGPISNRSEPKLVKLYHWF